MSIRMSLLSPLLFGVLFSVGCVDKSGTSEAEDTLGVADEALSEGSATTTATATTGQASTEKAVTKSGATARRRGPHGIEHAMVEALEDMELTDAQRDAISDALDAARPTREARPPMDSRIKELGAAIRKGDLSSIADQAEPKMPAERQAKEAALVEKIHSTLTSAQRKELVAALAEDGPEGGRPHGGRPEDGGIGPIGRMLDKLDLTDDQEAAIESALRANRPAKPSEVAMKTFAAARRAEVTTKLASFAADTFDAAAFVMPPARPEAAGKGDPMLRDLKVVLPQLTVAQRAALADELESGPPGPPPGDCGPDGAP